MPTYNPKMSQVTRQWLVIDAEDVVLGRLASQVAILLRGKHKPIWAPHVDTGDFVIVINAAKVAMTGNKRKQSVWYRHSGFPGGLRADTYDTMLNTKPEKLVEKSIVGMLPHNSLGRAQARKLKVYAGSEHPHSAQGPTPYVFTQVAQ